MADRPIIFSAPMVRALIDGHKTQTRRIVKKPAAIDALATFGPSFLTLPGNRDLLPVPVTPGDRLWVREACRAVEHEDGTDAVEYLADASCARIANTMQAADQWLILYHYGAKGPDRKNREGQKVPSIHMPRWASRLTLTVTDVRVQRLQEISEADAVAEGMEPYAGLNPDCHGFMNYQTKSQDGYWLSATDSFRTLWNSLHGPDAWAANPWVVAISFTVHRCNIDQIGGDT